MYLYRTIAWDVHAYFLQKASHYSHTHSDLHLEHRHRECLQCIYLRTVPSFIPPHPYCVNTRNSSQFTYILFKMSTLALLSRGLLSQSKSETLASEYLVLNLIAFRRKIITNTSYWQKDTHDLAQPYMQLLKGRSLKYQPSIFFNCTFMYHRNLLPVKRFKMQTYLGNQFNPRCSVLEYNILSSISQSGLHGNSKSSLDSSSFFLIKEIQHFRIKHLHGAHTRTSQTRNAALNHTYLQHLAHAAGRSGSKKQATHHFCMNSSCQDLQQESE